MKQFYFSVIALLLIVPAYTASASIGGTTLLEFKANASKNEVIIEWTAMEVDNQLFTLQRSADGIEFETVTELSGIGTSNSPTYYSATDEQPREGTSYYRLRLDDSNGNFFYSQIISIQLPIKTKMLIYPNPAVDHEKINVSITTEKPGTISITLYGPAGRIVFSGSINGAQGETSTSIDTSDLMPGIYTLLVGQDGKRIEKQRIVIGHLR